MIQTDNTNTEFKVTYLDGSKEFRKQSPLLNQTLTYVDRRTGQNSTLAMTPIFTRFAMKPESNASVCTR